MVGRCEERVSGFPWPSTVQWPHTFTAKQPGIIRAATQYGVASRIMDLCTFDVTQNPWRCGELFDAIVTDPPCESPRR